LLRSHIRVQRSGSRLLIGHLVRAPRCTLRPEVFPESASVAERWNTAFGRNSGAGEDGDGAGGRDPVADRAGRSHLLRNGCEKALSDLGDDVDLRINQFGDFVSYSRAKDNGDLGGVELVLFLQPRRKIRGRGLKRLGQ